MQHASARVVPIMDGPTVHVNSDEFALVERDFAVATRVPLILHDLELGANVADSGPLGKTGGKTRTFATGGLRGVTTWGPVMNTWNYVDG